MSSMQVETTKKVLEGRVARILNAMELAINIGANKGVEPGMVFAVLAEKPLEVRDPVSNEVLDVLDREKVRVKATDVREKTTMCRTYRTRQISGGPLYLPLLRILEKDLFEPSKEVPETLDTKDSSLPPPLAPEESYAKINDRVVLVDE